MLLKVKTSKIVLQSLILISTVTIMIDLAFLHPAKITVEEVSFIQVDRRWNLYWGNLLVNFSVVSGGAALIATSLVAGSGELTPIVGALIFGM